MTTLIVVCAGIYLAGLFLLIHSWKKQHKWFARRQGEPRMHP